MATLKYAPFTDKKSNGADNSIRAVRNTAGIQAIFSSLPLLPYIFLLWWTSPDVTIGLGIQRGILVIALPLIAGILGFMGHKKNNFLVPHFVFSILAVIVSFQDLSLTIYACSRYIIASGFAAIPWLWWLMGGVSFVQFVINIVGAGATAHILRQTSD